MKVWGNCFGYLIQNNVMLCITRQSIFTRGKILYIVTKGKHEVTKERKVRSSMVCSDEEPIGMKHAVNQILVKRPSPKISNPTS
jgi:hypothetical protein